MLLSLVAATTPAAAKQRGASRGDAENRADSDDRTASRELPAAALFGRVSPSIVVVEVALASGKSQGSGVVIGPELVVTNHHVVVGGKGAQVRQGSRSWPATVEAVSPQHDLAILRVAGLDLPRATLRASNLLTVGERVYAVGAPRGLELTLSDGLISALRREKPDKHKQDKAKETEDDGAPAMIQTTAPVSPGSSGGGLFDGQGRLVGVMTFVIKGGQSLNFAHPTEWVDELRAGKAGSPTPATAEAGYGLSQRPTGVKCEIDTRAVWGRFSGGAEILESSPVQFEIRFTAFEGQMPNFISSIEHQPSKGELVLADMNRDAGFIHFTSTAEQATDLDYFFSVDDDGRFRLTVIKPFDFHGQVRIQAMSGACQVRDKAWQADGTMKSMCKQGDVKSCLTAGAEVEKLDRAAALDLYLKGCARSGTENAAARGLVADCCTKAADLAERMGATARAQGLREQAAQLRAQKRK